MRQERQEHKHGGKHLQRNRGCRSLIAIIENSGELMSDTTGKAPWHLWVIGVFAVLFNSIGMFDFTMSMARGAEYMRSAGMTPEQIAHYQTLPAWMTVIWAIGVIGAFLGSILLLMRKRIASTVFIISLAAFVISLVHTYVLTDAGKVMGEQMAIVSAVIALLLVLFAWYSHAMSKRAWFGRTAHA
jgi:hypothetical protein